MKRIVEDARPIKAIECATSWLVGCDGITKIVPYEEAGHMAPLTWFAIYKGDFLYARVGASVDAEVYYKEQA